MNYTAEAVNDILIDSYEAEKTFYVIEISSRGPSRRKLKQTIREADDTRSFFLSQDLESPDVRSWLICRRRQISERNSEWTKHINYIHSSQLQKEFLDITKKKVLKLESYLTFKPVGRSAVKTGNIKRQFELVNEKTNGKLLEEYFSQVLHHAFEEAILIPRVIYNGTNGGAVTLRFSLNGEKRRPSELDVLLISEPDYVENRMALLEESRYGFTDLKKRLQNI